MSHVFISYAHEDEHFVNELKDRITSAGFDFWIDRERLQAGHNWMYEVKKAIEASYAVIVVKSPASQKSQYVISEWTHAQAKDVPLIPVLLEWTSETHSWLEVVQHIDFTDSGSHPWHILFELVDKKRRDFGVRVRIPNDVSPKVRDAIEALNSSFPEDVKKGAVQLGKLKDTAAIPGLIITLNHEENEAANAVIAALIEIGEPAVPLLVREFLDAKHDKDDSEVMRYRIIVTLSQINSDSTLDALIDALDDHRNRVRYLALYALGEMKRIEALPRIRRLTTDPDHIVRQTAIRILITMEDHDSIPILTAALQDEDKDIRSSAASGLGRLRASTAFELLLKALEDSEMSVRIAATRSIGQIGDPKAVDRLARLKDDPSDGVQQAAIDALSQIGSPEALQALIPSPKQN